MGRVKGVLLLGALTSLLLASGAAAEPVLKAGTTQSTTTNNCFPSGVTASYSQQVAGTEPKVGDIFYLSLRVDLTQLSFTCAADFTSVLATLPNNVAPAIGGSATTICRRWGTNSAGNQVFDNRAQTNCVANPTFNAGTHQFSMRPVDAPILPDVGNAGPNSGYWFTGIRSPEESQSYMSIQLLVPIKATATVSNQPMSFYVCTVGTDCVTASVNMSVTAAPVNADPPQISLSANSQVSAVGARVPFSINDNVTGSSYYLKVDTSTNPAFPVNTTTGRPCGLSNAFIYGTTVPGPFAGSTTSEVQYGDLQTGGTTCYLSPDTLYYVKVCTSDPATLFPFTDFAGCRTASFRTGAVVSTMELPGTDPQPSNTLSALTRVMAGHPAGSTRVQRRISAAGGSYTDASSNQSIAQSTSSSAQVSQAVTLPLPWQTYDLRVCFTAPTSCTPPVTYLAGAAQSDGDATGITSTTATVNGHPSAPHPSGDLVARIGTTNPGIQNPVTALTQTGGTTPMVDNPSNAAPSPTSISLTGLTPSTTYYWAACFDNPSQSGLEDCGTAESFTTAADPCVLNPNGPGCPVDPPTCAEDPSQSKCQSSGEAKLVVKKPRKLVLKAGRVRTLNVTLSNGGIADASASKICMSVPSKLKKKIKVPACVSLGTMAAGKSRTAAFRLKAKKGVVGSGSLKLQASWTGGKGSPVSVAVKIKK